MCRCSFDSSAVSQRGKLRWTSTPLSLSLSVVGRQPHRSLHRRLLIFGTEDAHILVVRSSFAFLYLVVFHIFASEGLVPTSFHVNWLLFYSPCSCWVAISFLSRFSTWKSFLASSVWLYVVNCHVFDIPLISFFISQ